MVDLQILCFWIVLNISSYNTFFGVEGVEMAATEANAPRRFFGTSCSATNIAAVAALLVQASTVFGTEVRRRLWSAKSAKKSKKKKQEKSSKKSKDTNNDFVFPYDLYSIMEESAIDMNEPGFDFLTGHGFVNAMAAVEAVKTAFGASEEGDSEAMCPVQSFLDPILSYY